VSLNGLLDDLLESRAELGTMNLHGFNSLMLQNTLQGSNSEYLLPSLCVNCHLPLCLSCMKFDFSMASPAAVT
jgi:hypothetical protein